MRAMVMAAGLGTRLRPITHEIPKPVVPVGNVAIVEQLVRLLAEHGVEEVIANLHWFPETVEGRLGDGSSFGVELSYRHEDELLGTAGGVRNVADFLTADADTFIVLAGDALTDVDLTALTEAHRANGGVATLAVKKVQDVSEYGVIVAGSDGRVQGFQEKPDPAEALSDLVNCMVYAFSPELFDYFPREEMEDPVDFANDVFPALLAQDVAFHVHEVDGYWNDIGTLREYLQGNLDAVEGAVKLPRLGGQLVDGARPTDEVVMGDDVEIEGKVLFGEGCRVGSGVWLSGPLVIGPGAEVGEAAQVKESVLLPGAMVPAGGVLARGIAGDAARLASGDW
ncbi:MAG: NDP-sugar synthase [Solirubrobacterales bacterium]|nr:NDP-sugar synthase [Solirubrobacterales bacterium]